MELQLDIQLKEKDLYRFNLFQTYTSSQGIVSIVLAILGVIMAVTSFEGGNIGYGVMYVAFSVIILLYIPISLRGRVKLTLKNNEVLAGVLHYHFTEKEIKVTSGEDSGELPWKQIYKMIDTKHNVLIYSGRRNAYVLPKDQIGDNYETLKAIAEKVLEPHRVKLR